MLLKEKNRCRGIQLACVHSLTLDMKDGTGYTRGPYICTNCI